VGKLGLWCTVILLVVETHKGNEKHKSGQTLHIALFMARLPQWGSCAFYAESQK
jgi:hypothetical protein